MGATILGVFPVNPSFANEAVEPTEAFKQACEAQLQPGGVSVTFDAAPLQLDRQQSKSDIARNSGTGRDVLHGSAQSARTAEVRLSGDSLFDPSTSIECARPNIDVTIRLVRRVLRIASDVPEGSACYHEVMRHEQSHVAVTRKYGNIVRETLREQLNREYAGQVFYGLKGTVLPSLFEAIEEHSRSTVADRREESLEQKEVDAYESRRSNRSCYSTEFNQQKHF